ncbi:MAG: lysophospholipid acyltransferase family protein [Steroidobacteraceae bacterium]
MHEFIVRRILPPVAQRVYSGLAGSWHYETENEPVLKDLLEAERPVVGAFLHSRTFQLLYYFSRPERGRWMLMCSRSSDGDLMTRVEQSLGYRVARGSSGSGGARALAEMIKAQREDRQLNSCLAVDGSRGPRGIAQLGILTLARKTGGMLLPVAASTSACWVLNSWDRTVIPKPRARISILIGEPMQLPARMDEQEAESLRLELQRRLLAMHRDLDSRTGFTDSQPLQLQPCPP